MDKLNELLNSIKVSKSKYDEKREKNRFNIFTAMYKSNEEVKLHSRFISYLLCSKSGHGMGGVFFKLFLHNVLNLTENDFDVSNYQILPNEIDKREYENIDILVHNKSQAIIVENKVDAGDSNHRDARDGYKGQLERYYNTIKTGENKDFKSLRIKRNSVFVYYLSKGNPPSEESLGQLLTDKNKRPDWKGVLSYGDDIRGWLIKCIEESIDKPSLKEFIQQYLNLINKMTHNDIFEEEKNELKDLLSKNLESTKYLMDYFKHVKWYTVNAFWIELKKELEKESKYFKNAKLYPENTESYLTTIGKITHESKNINHGILFDFENGKLGYISGMNELSWGIVNEGWLSFKCDLLQDINFSNFSSTNTYRLIDKEIMENSIKLIIAEIIEEIKNDFQNIEHKST